jgi:hypothetical protein
MNGQNNGQRHTYVRGYRVEVKQGGVFHFKTRDGRSDFSTMDLSLMDKHMRDLERRGEPKVCKADTARLWASFERRRATA